MTLVNTNKSVKKSQKQRCVVGMGPQSVLFMLEITCVQEISLALICLNTLGKTSVSIQEMSESVQAQGCCIQNVEMETETGMGAGKHNLTL